MGGLLYYFPGVKVLDEADVVSRGLSSVLDGNRSIARIERGGPDGGDGFIATLDSSRACTCSPDEQEWQERRGFWIGHWKGAAYLPQDFARERQYAGHLVTLADGNQWLVPVVRLFDGDSPLPQRLAMGADGAIAGTILPRFSQLFDDANHVWDSVLLQVPGHTGRTLPRDIGWRVAVDALSLNYRIGNQEASLLGLFTDGTLLDVLEAIVDLPNLATMVEESKKNGPALAAVG